MASHNNATESVEKLIVQVPQHAASLQKMLQHHQNKLWYQLSLEVQSFIGTPAVRGDVDLVQFYTSFVTDWANKMNPLLNVQISISVSKQIQDTKNRIAFLAHIFDNKTIREAKDAHVTAVSTLAEMKIATGNQGEAQTELEAIEKDLDDLSTADSSVYAAYYKARASLFKAKVQPQEFYRNGLQYLAYAKVESVDQDEKALLAYDLALAALVGEEIFNFGELIENQVFDALQGTPNAWLGLVLKAFNHGNIREWKSLEQQYSAQLNQTPILVSNQSLLENKIAILGVMELLFTRGSVDRSVTFDQVSEVTQRPIDKVEHLLMRALSLGLIRGSIDQTSKTIHITWVQPRVLNIEQIASMKNKLVEWKGRVKEALTLVENQMTPELIS